MQDFFKIFIVLCISVGAFMFGRNYGEKTYRETDEFRNLVKSKEELTFAKGELENVKIKFQNIINNSGNKNPEELFAETLQIFLADLRLIAAKPMQTPAPSAEKKVEKTVDHQPSQATKSFDMKRLKSYEWILANSSDKVELRKNLKNVELKNLNQILSSARKPALSEFEPILGTYRGPIIGVDSKAYGSMLIEIATVHVGATSKATGAIKIFRGDLETMNNSFSSTSLGFVVDGSSCFILNPGNDNKFYQLYKIRETQQVAGFFYERLVNGTTKTIGSFVLNRTDQF